MGKLSTSEHFFISKIAEGMELKGSSISQEDIEKLLPNGLHCEDGFKEKITASLEEVYSREAVENFEVLVGKLYAGRETLLRDIIVEWYKKNKAPKGWFERLKELFSK